MDIKAMMQQARKMQADLDKAKAALAEQEITVAKQGVTIVMKGTRQVSRIDIDEALIDPDDPELLADLMMLAINDAIKQVDALEKAIQPQGPGGF